MCDRESFAKGPVQIFTAIVQYDHASGIIFQCEIVVYLAT